jgi:F-type H+-transporting ATPase subunit delta
VKYAAIAERYARALLELGQETHELAQLTEQIARVADVYAGNGELRAVLDNPIVAEAQREAVLRDVAARLDLKELAVNTLRLLARRRRLHALPDIAEALRTLSDQASGILRATVTSAAPLSPDYCEKLTRQLEHATQKKVVLDKRTDPSLIAGVVTRIGDHTIDGSLKGRLADLERQILQEA